MSFLVVKTLSQLSKNLKNYRVCNFVIKKSGEFEHINLRASPREVSLLIVFKCFIQFSRAHDIDPNTQKIFLTLRVVQWADEILQSKSSAIARV